MRDDVGPSEGRFPPTRGSVVLAARDADPEVRRQAFGAIVEGYWKPAYKYLRVQWRADAAAAEDLTQEFFARALEKGTFARYDPGKARFRTYLRTCLDGFAANEQKAARREKRGGGRQPLPLDFPGAEAELARQGGPEGLDMETWFHREWVRALFAAAVEALRQRCRESGHELRFALFARYDLDPADGGERATYAELAREHGVPVTQVTNELAAARRELRRIVLERLAELTGSQEELEAEARAVLGRGA